MGKDRHKDLPEEIPVRLPEVFFYFIVFFIAACTLTALVDLFFANTLFLSGGPESGFTPTVYFALAAAARAALLAAAAVFLKKRDLRFTHAYMAALALTAVTDVLLLYFCVSTGYAVFRLAAGTVLMGLWPILLYAKKSFQGFPPPFSAAKPPLTFGGLLLPLAFWLLLRLQNALNGLVNLPFSIGFSSLYAKESFTEPSFSAAALHISYIPLLGLLGVLSAVFFFRRKKAFKPAAAAFAGIQIAYRIAITVITAENYAAAGAGDFAGLFAAVVLSNAVQAILPAAVLLYIFFSRRVRRTFIWGRKEGDPLAVPFKSLPPGNTEPIPLYGLAVLLCVQCAVMVHASFNGFYNALQVSGAAEFSFAELLGFTAATAVSIWCFYLLFRQKRLFKYVYTVLGIACLIYFAVVKAAGLKGFAEQSAAFADLAAVQTEYILAVFTGVAGILYQGALLIYTVLSLRVKRTFGNRTRFTFLSQTAEKLRDAIGGKSRAAQSE